jgi:uncharacterized membrane protein
MSDSTAASPAARNVREIARLERSTAETMTAGQRLSLGVTNAIGTGSCAAAHVIAFLTWIGWNGGLAPEKLQFDPYPFGLLTMWVSMEGVVLAILVLITQNRMSRQTDRRDHLDLQIDLLAEQEMTLVLRGLTRIEERLGIQKDGHEQRETAELMQPTDLHQLVNEMDREIK